jgi:hypothetical protein
LVEGTPEAVARLGPVDARAFHARVFTASNALFFATGDLSASEILRKVEASFGDWPAGSVPEPGPAPPAPAPPERRIVLVDRPDLGQAQILVGHEGISRTDPERLPASLLNTVLGGDAFSSRLMTRVRAEEGLTYSVSSFFAMRRHPGPFAVSTFTRVPEVRRVIDLLLAELERVRLIHRPRGGGGRPESDRRRIPLPGARDLSAVASALDDLDVHGLPEDSLDTFRGASARSAPRTPRGRLATWCTPNERPSWWWDRRRRPSQLQDLGAVEVVQP